MTAPSPASILRVLRERGPLTTREVADALGADYDRVYSVLRSLAGIERSGRRPNVRFGPRAALAAK